MMNDSSNLALIISLLFAGLVLLHVTDAYDPQVPGAIVIVASVEMEPYLMRNPDYIEGSDSQRFAFIGFIADLVDRLSLDIGFDYVIHTVTDGSFGNQRDDGSWDGVVGELISGHADMAAAPMYATAQRSRVIDFTDPFMSVSATILIRRPHSHINVTPQISSLKDLIRQSEIRYGTLNRGVLVRAFRRTNVTVYRSAWRQMTRFRPSVFTSTNEQGIERLRTPGERYAFIVPHPIGDYVASREPCDLVAVGRFLEHRGYSLALPRGIGARAASTSSSTLEPIVDRTTLNAAIRRLSENGFVDELYRKWWTEGSNCVTSAAGSTNGNGNGVALPKRQAAYAAAIYGDGGSVIKNRAADSLDTYVGDEIGPREMDARGYGRFSAVSGTASFADHTRSLKSMWIPALSIISLYYKYISTLGHP